MRVTSVCFKGLFHHYNHTIHFNDTVTIIHGLNGCGKTTMLKLLDAIFNLRLEIVSNIDFETVNVTFSDGRTLTIEKKPNSLKYTTHKNDITTKKEIDIRCFLSASNSPTISFDDEMLTPSDYQKRHMQKRDLEIIKTTFGEIFSSLNVRFITTERLFAQNQKIRIRKDSRESIYIYNQEYKKNSFRVSEIADNIATKIIDAIQAYAQLSQTLDRSFPIRSIRESAPMQTEEIKSKLIALEQKRSQLIEIGILQEEKDIVNINEFVDSINDSNRQNLSLYVKDTEKKLDVLSEISSSIHLYQELINRSFTGKKIIFSKDYGFRFKPDYSDDLLPPQKLSSGEQHEIIMLYDLIFNTNENTLILIDEPEISLHIKWQLSYVDNLLSIIKKTGFYAVLATHSPQIIDDKWDLTVSLKS